ncbi:MAG: cadherin-like domain-containing protein [Alphaproteobacteria bacterium]
MPSQPPWRDVHAATPHAKLPAPIHFYDAVRLSSRLFSRTNYLIVVADYDDKVNDLNRDNNSYKIAITLDDTFPEEPQSTLPVAVGGTATISTEFLLSTDNYSGPEGLTYTIVTAPGYGTLLLDGVATSTFTQADIDSGRVQYRQDGAAGTQDGFTFTVADEAGNWIGPEPFTIAIVDTADPVVFENDTITVSAGGTYNIWKDALCTVALGNDPDEMVYTITAGPSHGTLWIDGKPATSFTQADIDLGGFGYFQNGGEALVDSFTFTVTDRDGTQTAPHVFQILIQDGTGAMTVADDPLAATAPDAIITDLSGNAPAAPAGALDNFAAFGDPAAFEYADLTAFSTDSDLFTGWSDDPGGSGNGVYAAYLELEPRWDSPGDGGEAGDGGGGW